MLYFDQCIKIRMYWKHRSCNVSTMIQRGYQPFNYSYKICWKKKITNCDKWTLSLCKVLCLKSTASRKNKWMEIWRKTYYGTWKSGQEEMHKIWFIYPPWNSTDLWFFPLFSYGWVFHWFCCNSAWFLLSISILTLPLRPTHFSAVVPTYWKFRIVYICRCFRFTIFMTFKICILCIN